MPVALPSIFRTSLPLFIRVDFSVLSSWFPSILHCSNDTNEDMLLVSFLFHVSLFSFKKKKGRSFLLLFFSINLSISLDRDFKFLISEYVCMCTLVLVYVLYMYVTCIWKSEINPGCTHEESRRISYLMWASGSKPGPLGLCEKHFTVWAISLVPAKLIGFLDRVFLWAESLPIQL